MKRALFVVALLAVAVVLTGCASTPPAADPVVVYQKVKEPCISKAPAKPAYQTGRGAYPGDKAAALALASDFEKAEHYGAQWEAAAAGCIKPE